MALSNYTELQAAVRVEMGGVSTGGLSADALTDAIARAEAKINRKTRLREAETLAEATYTSASRFMALPADYVEILDLQWKVAGAADTTYAPVDYVAPQHMAEMYGSNRFVYTLRKDIEFNQAATSDRTILIHYLAKWDIATDTTNWLLTNYPDVYLYGACFEASAHMRDEAADGYLVLFNQALAELDALSERGRDDSEADISDLAAISSGSGFNILRG